MVGEAAFRRSSRVRWCVSLLAWVVGVGGCFALPAVARATPYSPPGLETEEPPLPEAACPAAPAASEGGDQVVVELRELRRDAAAICSVVVGRLDVGLHRAWWPVAELRKLRDRAADLAGEAGLLNVSQDLQALDSDLTPKAGLPVLVAGQAEDLATTVSGGVALTNPPDLTPVRAAVVEGTETSNQNIWAVLGVVVGFGFLACLYKLVRP